MPRLTVQIDRGQIRPAFERFYAESQQEMERAALVASDRASKQAVTNIRREMQGARLGRLGGAIGQNSDLQKGRIHRSGAENFSASGAVFVRSRSERTRGTIESYTEGSTIRPVRGRWLWIATNEIPARAGRERMTPDNYRRADLERRIGPLVMVRSINGNPLLIVQSASVSEVGKARSAKARTKTGKLRKGQREKQFIVAFIGIPATSRAARVDVESILTRAAADMPSMVGDALKKGR